MNNQVNVTGLNPGQGGPGGGVPMMNNGSTAPRTEGAALDTEQMLNTYIYDYFLKRGYYECARMFWRDESVRLSTEPITKPSPGHRRDGDVNGIDTDAMMSDSKDGDKLKIPDDLPLPQLPNHTPQSSFLLDWFSLFWEMFWTIRKKGQSIDAGRYVQYMQVISPRDSPALCSVTDAAWGTRARCDSKNSSNSCVRNR
jgi:LisH